MVHVMTTTTTDVLTSLPGDPQAGVAEAMATCMASVTGDAANKKTMRTDCKDTTAKTELASLLGKQVSEVSAAELQKFLDGAARNNMAKAMDGCMKAAGSEATKMTACRDVTAKQSLATSLGKDLADVSATELDQFRKKAARSDMAEKMKSCVSTAADKAAKTACSASAGKDAMAAALGKSAASISTFELKKFQEGGAEDAFKSSMEACMKAAGAVPAACTTTATGAYAESMGKEAGDFDAAAIQDMKQKSAGRAMKDAMGTCMDTAGADKVKMKACKDTNGKNAMMAALGKTTATDTEVEAYVRKAAEKETASVMGSCMEVALIPLPRMTPPVW
jgi:hypothetical protein